MPVKQGKASRTEFKKLKAAGRLSRIVVEETVERLNVDGSTVISNTRTTTETYNPNYTNEVSPETEPVSAIHKSVNYGSAPPAGGGTMEEKLARWRSYPIESVLRWSQCTKVNHNHKTAVFKRSSMSGNFGVDCKAMDARSFLELEGWAIAHIGV